MKTDKPYSVCFYVQDEKKCQELWSSLVEALASDKELWGARVTALGKEDVFSELEKYENGWPPAPR